MNTRIVKTDVTMPIDRAIALCESLGLDPTTTIAITLRAGMPVEVLVEEKEEA